MATNSGIQQTVAKVRTNELRANGIYTVIGSETVNVTNRGINGLVSQCYGTTVPTDATAGYEVGAKFFKTNGSVGSTEYTNEGSITSCDFNVVESSASTITSVTAGTGCTGGATEGAATINVGAGRGTTVRADNTDVGVDVFNNTGGTLAVGTLVNLSGFTGTSGVVVSKANADAGVRATHVVLDAINDATAGVVYPSGVGVNVNTGGRTIGDLVYLDATTSGGFTFTAPTGADQMVQVVGVVKVVHASTGEIVFFPGFARVTKIPQSLYQTASMNRTGMTAAAGSKINQVRGATVATTGNADEYITVPETGTITSAEFAGVDALAANDTNYITFSITNLGQAGADSTVILAATDANTTKATGGTALSANTKRSLTLTGT